MKIKELDKYFDRDTKVTIDYKDAPEFDDGTLKRIIRIYGDCLIHELSPVWDAVSQTAKLKIVAKMPPKRGRPRKKV